MAEPKSDFHGMERASFGDSLVALIHEWRLRRTAWDEMEASLEEALANVRAQERDE